MRALVPAAVLPLMFALTGCGDTSTPNDPPSPPPRTPAALALAAGDAQQAPAGSAVAIAPSVMVRDGQGQPLAGVTVQFAVSAGGGQVAGGSPITDASGVASVTSWVLGPNGDQRLSAQVGSLPAVVFAASITPGTGIHTGTVGSGGGTVAIAEPGHPYHGLTLTIPAGTAAASTDWRFRIDPSAPAVTLPAGASVAGPVLEISTSHGRGNRLMQLEVPIPETAEGRLFLALHDPARNVIELLPTVARTATSVVVATAHLRASLIQGPAPLLAQRFAAASLASDEVARLIPIAIDNMTDLLTNLETFTALMNRWPVRDHGSAAFPGGHSTGIAALEAVATIRNFPSLSETVKSLSIPGFYAEAAPLAVAQLAQQRISASLTQSLAELGPMYDQHDKPTRDALVLESIVANVRLTGRASLVAGISNAGSGVPVAASVVSGTIGSLSLVSPATTEPTQVTLGVGGMGNIMLSLVANGEAQPVANLVPLSSFVYATEEADNLLVSLRRMIDATTEAARDAVNRQLASEAGLPDLNVEIQHLPEDTWTSAQAATGINLVARSQAAKLRVLANAISVHRPDGSEVARTVGDALSIAEDLDLSSEPAATQVRRTITAFASGAGSAIRQVAVAQARVTLAPFKVEPDEVTLEGDNLLVELEASVPLPPADGYLIEWVWGDGETTEYAGTTTASHQYDSTGSYDVVATLMASADRRKLAVDTVKVRGPQHVWIGTVTARAVYTTPGHLKTLVTEATNLRFERAVTDESGQTRYDLTEGTLRVWNEVPCASYVSPVVQISLAGQTRPQWITISETNPAGGTQPGPGQSPLWYAAHGSATGMQILNKVCASDLFPNPEAYVFATGAIWLNTSSLTGSDFWRMSTNRNVLEGSYTRLQDDVTTTWTWRFERASADQ